MNRPLETEPSTGPFSGIPPKWWRGLTTLWFAAIAAGSFFPFSWKLRLRTHGPMHLPLHFGVFLVGGFLATGTQATLPRRLVAAFLAIAFGAILEILESVLYGNSLELRDILADSLGVLLGLLIVFALPNSRIESTQL